MTIQECYKEMGGDFEGVQKRFGGVALVEKSVRSEEHTSELQSLCHISYAVFCLKKRFF